MNEFKSSFMEFPQNIQLNTLFLCENRLIYKLKVATSPPVLENYSSTPLAGINAGENFETAFSTKYPDIPSTPETLPTLENMKKVAGDIMFNFYKNIRPDETDTQIQSYVNQFYAVIDAITLDANELLPAEKQEKYYEAYLDTLEHFSDLQNESITKNGVMSVDGFMLGNNRVENFELKKPFTAKLKTPPDPVAYLKDKKNKTSVPFPDKYSRKQYPNLTILELEGISPVIFKTGIVSIEEVTFHDKIIGVRILDGDGDFHLYDARTHEFKAVIESPSQTKKSTTTQKNPPTKNTRVTSLHSKDTIYTSLNANHKALFSMVAKNLKKKIADLHAKNEETKFDWADWGGTPFEVNKNGDIVLDRDDYKNDTDIVILTAKEVQTMNTQKNMGNAQSLADILNQYRELLDTKIIDKTFTRTSTAKAPYQKTNTQEAENKKGFLSNIAKKALYKKAGIAEKINSTEKNTELKYKGVTFKYLNQNNKQRNNSKNFIENNIKLLTNLGKNFTGINNSKITIEERLGKNKNPLLVIQKGNDIYGSLLDKTKNPEYRKLNNKTNQWENTDKDAETNFLTTNINPFYTHLTGHVINRTHAEKIAKEKENQDKNDKIVNAPAVAVEIKPNNNTVNKPAVAVETVELSPNQTFNEMGIKMEQKGEILIMRKGGVQIRFPSNKSQILQLYKDLGADNNEYDDITEKERDIITMQLFNYFAKKYTRKSPLIIDFSHLNKIIMQENHTKYEISIEDFKEENAGRKQTDLEIKKFANQYIKELSIENQEKIEKNDREEVKKMILSMYKNISKYKKILDATKVIDKNNKEITDIFQKAMLFEKMEQSMIMLTAYSAKSSKEAATIIINMTMQKENPETPPKLGSKEILTISPTDDEYKVLKSLFGDFKKFDQHIQYVNNARWGALTFGDSIYIGFSNNPLDKKAILLNELVHGLIEKEYPSFSAKNEEKWINNIENIQINEFLSDVASFAIDPTGSFKILQNWGKDNSYLENAPNYKYTIEFFKENLETLKQKNPNKSDEFYAKKMAEIYMKKGQEFVEIIKNKEKTESKKQEV